MKTRIPCLIQFERQTLCMKYNSPSRVRTVTQLLTQHHHYPTPPKRRYFFLPNISWLLHEVRPTTEEWETPDGPASQALTTSQRIRLAYGDTLVRKGRKLEKLTVMNGNVHLQRLKNNWRKVRRRKCKESQR